MYFTAAVVYRIHVWLIFDLQFDEALYDNTTVAWFTFTMSITAAVSHHTNLITMSLKLP